MSGGASAACPSAFSVGENGQMFTGGAVIAPAGRGWLRALRLTTPDLGAVTRSLLGILAMAAVALSWSPGASAMWTVGAAAIAGVIALRDSPGGRVPVVVIASLEMAAAVLLGALTAPYGSLFVGVVAMWCFAAGMQWALSGNAGFIAAAASGLLVIAPPVSPSPSDVVTSTVLTLAAGLVQAALIAVWPPQRWRVQRDALSRAYRSLGADARTMASETNTPVETTPLTWLREAFVEGEAANRSKAFQGGYRLTERITASLTALRENPAGPRDDGVSQMLSAAARFLDAIADHGHTARRDAEQALVQVDAAAMAVTGPEAATAQRLSQQLHEAAVLRFGQLHRPDLIGWIAAAAVVIRHHLAWRSPILRHAIRLAVTAAVGTAVARFTGVMQGYWITLTVLMVLRPETAHTYTRCAGRLGGIAAGIVVASVLEMMWQPTGMAAAVCVVVFLGLTYAVSGFGYLAVSTSLAAVIVFIIDVGGAVPGSALEDRLFAVAIGGGLAVVAHVALPDHGLIRLRQRAGELLMTEIDYAAMVVHAFVHELDRPAEALSAAWQRAFRARAAFEAASGAARVDSRELRRWLRSYRSALNAVTSACTSLESSLPARPSTALTREFIAAVDEYVDALRGAPPSPATPWTVDIAELTAANQRVREVASSLAADNGAARVLVAELATITQSVSGIAVDVRDVAPP
jgi:uncharacterized membrane protein YccC